MTLHAKAATALLTTLSLAALPATLGCSREASDGAAANADSGATTGASAAASTGAASADGGKLASATSGSGAATAAGAPAGQARALSGSYTAAKSTFYVPDAGEWKGVTWRGEADQTGIGAGTLKVNVGADGKVTGTLAGALGDLVLDGMDRDGRFTAAITPAAAANVPNGGFTGTLVATDDGSAVKGTMHLSDGQNRLIREADVTLSPSK